MIVSRVGRETDFNTEGTEEKKGFLCVLCVSSVPSVLKCGFVRLTVESQKTLTLNSRFPKPRPAIYNPPSLSPRDFHEQG